MPWRMPATSQSATLERSFMIFFVGTEDTEDLVKHVNNVCIPNCAFKGCEQRM